MKFDREFLRGFDDFFQLKKTKIFIDDFVFELENKYVRDNYSLVRLYKNNDIFWKLEFILPSEYILRLNKNVHPIFKEYIDDRISIYADNKLYRFINENILEIYRAIAEISYDPISMRKFIDFSDFFINRCKDIAYGEERQISTDKFLKVFDEDNVLIRNYDKSFMLSLHYNSDYGESMLDSLIDMQKSIMLKEV